MTGFPCTIKLFGVADAILAPSQLDAVRIRAQQSRGPQYPQCHISVHLINIGIPSQRRHVLSSFFWYTSSASNPQTLDCSARESVTRSFPNTARRESSFLARYFSARRPGFTPAQHILCNHDVCVRVWSYRRWLVANRV